MDYEAEDKGVLVKALLALRTCPHCRADLQPVAFCDDVWGCTGKHPPRHHAAETWHLPREGSDSCEPRRRN